MPEVDERIVRMRFDNAQFERGVSTSIKSLDKLKQSLSFKEQEQNFVKLERTANKIDFSGLTLKFNRAVNSFDLSPVTRSIENLQASMENSMKKATFWVSPIGEIIKKEIGGAFDFVKNKAESTWNSMFGQIVSGGKSRAMNIANAKFQLEGLGVAWESIEKDISYGVDSTAYGLDAAAVAASQLVASGVEFGEAFGTVGNSPMAKALRGISGVAAMTNSSFEDISRIFTTVAGQGRIMGDQLNQLAARGLNVAADLAKVYNVTEAELRDMVSKGKIDFAAFSEAMDNAYGAHAKEANKTFNGALSNMKSALSRIGALFATPAYDNLIGPLNQLRDLFNEIKTAITPLSESVTKLMEAVSKLAVTIIEKLTPAITGWLTPLFDKASAFADILTGWATSWEEMISKITVTKDVGETIKAISEAEIEAAKAIWETGKYGTGSDRVKLLTEAFGEDGAKRVQDFIDNFIKNDHKWGNETEKTAEQVKTSLDGITDAEIEAAKAIWEKGKYGNGAERIKLLTEEFGPDGAKRVQAYVDDFIKNDQKWADISKDTTEEVEDSSDTVIETLVNIRDTLVNMGKVVVNVVGVIRNVVRTAANTFIKTFHHGEVTSDIESVSESLVDFTGRLVDLTKDSPKIESFFTTIWEHLNRGYEMIKGVTSLIPALRDEIFKTVTEIIDSVKEGDSPLVTLINLRDALINVGKVVVNIGKTVKNVLKTAVKTFLKTFHHNDISSDIETLSGSLVDITARLAEITEDSPGLERFFTKVWEFANKIYKVLSGIVKFVVNPKRAITNLKDSIVKSVKDVTSSIDPSSKLGRALTALGKIFSGVWEFGKKIVDKVAGFFRGNKLTAVMGDTSNVLMSSGDAIKGFVDNVLDKLVRGLELVANLDFTKVTNFFSNLGDNIGNGLKSSNILKNIYNAIQTAFIFIKNGFSKLFSDTGILHGAFEFAKNLVGAIWQGLKSVNFKTVIEDIGLFFFVRQIYQTTKLIENAAALVGSVNGFVKSIKGVISDLTKTIKGFGQYLKSSARIQTINAITLMFVSIAASLFILSQVPEAALQKAMGVMLVMSACIVIIIYMLGILTKDHSLIDRSGARANVSILNFNGIAQILIGLAAVMAATAYAFKTIADLLISIDTEDPKQVWAAIGAVLGVVAVMISMFIIARELLTTMSKRENKNFSKLALLMVSLGLVMIMFARSVSIIAKAMNKTSVGKVAGAFLIMSIMVALLTFMTYKISTISGEKIEITKIVYVILTIVSLIGAVWALVPAMLLIGMLPIGVILKGALTIVAILGALIGLVALINHMAKTGLGLNSFLILSGVFMVLVGLSILISQMGKAGDGLKKVADGLVYFAETVFYELPKITGTIVLSFVPLVLFGVALGVFGAGAVIAGAGAILLAAAFALVAKALTFLPEAAQGLADFGDILLQNKESILASVATIGVIIIAGLFSAIWAGKKTIALAIIGVVVAVAAILGKYSDKIVLGIYLVLKKIGNFLNGVIMDIVVWLVDWVVRLLFKLASYLGGPGGSGIVDAIGAVIDALLIIIVEAVAMLFQELYKAVGLIWNGTFGQIPGWQLDVKGFNESIDDTVQDMVEPLQKSIETAYLQYQDSLEDWEKEENLYSDGFNPGESIKNKFNEGKDKVTEGIDNLTSGLSSNGIASALESFTDSTGMSLGAFGTATSSNIVSAFSVVTETWNKETQKFETQTMDLQEFFGYSDAYMNEKAVEWAKKNYKWWGMSLTEAQDYFRSVGMLEQNEELNPATYQQMFAYGKNEGLKAEYQTLADRATDILGGENVKKNEATAYDVGYDIGSFNIKGFDEAMQEQLGSLSYDDYLQAENLGFDSELMAEAGFSEDQIAWFTEAASDAGLAYTQELSDNMSDEANYDVERMTDAAEQLSEAIGTAFSSIANGPNGWAWKAGVDIVEDVINGIIQTRERLSFYGANMAIFLREGFKAQLSKDGMDGYFGVNANMNGLATGVSGQTTLADEIDQVYEEHNGDVVNAVLSQSAIGKEILDQGEMEQKMYEREGAKLSAGLSLAGFVLTSLKDNWSVGLDEWNNAWETGRFSWKEDAEPAVVDIKDSYEENTRHLKTSMETNTGETNDKLSNVSKQLLMYALQSTGENKALADKLDGVNNRLDSLNAKPGFDQMQIILDSGALAGSVSQRVDALLGLAKIRKGRGN